jgi:hypothetical protein
MLIAGFVFTAEVISKSDWGVLEYMELSLGTLTLVMGLWRMYQWKIERVLVEFPPLVVGIGLSIVAPVFHYLDSAHLMHSLAIIITSAFLFYGLDIKGSINISHRNTSCL